MQSDAHFTLQVFGRDTILTIAMRADWQAIQTRRQTAIEHDNAVENSNRIEHTCEVGYKVTCKKHGMLTKLVTPRRGPCQATHACANGTVRIQRGSINERVDIRHLAPFLEET